MQLKADWKSISVDAPDFDRALLEVGANLHYRIPRPLCTYNKLSSSLTTTVVILLFNDMCCVCVCVLCVCVMLNRFFLPLVRKTMMS
jgi:hypothetical protein